MRLPTPTTRCDYRLVGTPALEHSNELFALAIATGCLHASGHRLALPGQDATDLIDNTKAGAIDVRQIAAVLKAHA